MGEQPAEDGLHHEQLEPNAEDGAVSFLKIRSLQT